MEHLPTKSITERIKHAITARVLRLLELIDDNLYEEDDE